MKGKKRWIAPWAGSEEKPWIYHCVSREVDRRFVFGDEERGKFRMFMRMMENFSGCRVLSYCVMSNHFHILLEVPCWIWRVILSRESPGRTHGRSSFPPSAFRVKTRMGTD